MQTVLVIEDDFAMRLLCSEILKMHGFNVVASACGTEALTILREIKKPDIILSDYLLKDMTGSEFLNYYKKLYPLLYVETPVVYYTCMEDVPMNDVRGVINKTSGVDNFLMSLSKFAPEKQLINSFKCCSAWAL